MSDIITFLASIAPLQSAMTVASDGGVRVKLDIPESHGSRCSADGYAAEAATDHR